MRGRLKCAASDSVSSEASRNSKKAEGSSELSPVTVIGKHSGSKSGRERLPLLFLPEFPC